METTAQNLRIIVIATVNEQEETSVAVIVAVSMR